MVADLDRATFSNIEHLSQEFVTFTLMPYLTRFEASVRKWLLRARDGTTGRDAVAAEIKAGFDAVAKQNRRLIFDSKGEPIGIEPI